MKLTGFVQYALGVSAAAAILVGCSSGGSLSPPGTSPQAQNAQSGLKIPSLVRQPIFALGGVPMRAHQDYRASWMTAGATSGDLLYISANGNSSVYVYSWPQLQPVGQIQGGSINSPWGLCVDEDGDVFVADAGYQQVEEFAHGGTTPIQILSEPGQYPTSCAVNNGNGKLAVMNAAGSPGSSVWIYKNHTGTPKVYTDPGNINQFLYGGYHAGNLYVDGITSSNAFRFAELPKGSTSFTDITLNPTINYPGGVQWDGTYVAVGDQGAGKYPNQSDINQYTISGSAGTRVGSTPINNSGDIIEFWIQGKKVIAPNPQYGTVFVLDYPAGGNALETIDLNDSPISAVISKPDPR
jgi:NHL repeat